MAYISIACIIIYVICFAIGLGKAARAGAAELGACQWRLVLCLAFPNVLALIAFSFPAP